MSRSRHTSKLISRSSGTSCSYWSSVARNFVGELYLCCCGFVPFALINFRERIKSETDLNSLKVLIQDAFFFLRRLRTSAHCFPRLFPALQISFESQKNAMMEQQQALGAKSIGLQEQVIELQKVVFPRTRTLTPAHGQYNIPRTM